MPNISGYDWASHDVSEYNSLFSSRVELKRWVENNCVLRTLDCSSLIKLSACKDNERVFHGKENHPHDLFFTYTYMFREMYIQMPFNSFQMGVLKVLNTTPSQLHPNSWGYIEAFAIVCQVIRITLTLVIFLYHFRTRLNAKKGGCP